MRKGTPTGAFFILQTQFEYLFYNIIIHIDIALYNSLSAKGAKVTESVNTAFIKPEIGKL